MAPREDSSTVAVVKRVTIEVETVLVVLGTRASEMTMIWPSIGMECI